MFKKLFIIVAALITGFGSDSECSRGRSEFSQEEIADASCKINTLRYCFSSMINVIPWNKGGIEFTGQFRSFKKTIDTCWSTAKRDPEWAWREICLSSKDERIETLINKINVKGINCTDVKRECALWRLEQINKYWKPGTAEQNAQGETAKKKATDEAEEKQIAERQAREKTLEQIETEEDKAKEKNTGTA